MGLGQFDPDQGVATGLLRLGSWPNRTGGRDTIFRERHDIVRPHPAKVNIAPIHGQPVLTSPVLERV